MSTAELVTQLGPSSRAKQHLDRNFVVTLAHLVDELKDVVNPYAKNNVSRKITGVLKTFSSEKLLEKNFVDLI